MNEKTRATLTLEAFLYGLIFAAALALRMLHLGAHPLNDLEAREALTVLGHLRGTGDAALGPQSPAYFFFTFITFLLFGASDATARAGPALAGAALVLVPALYRERLGRGGALAASALLAIASSLLAASRGADGVIFAVLGLSTAVGALLRRRESGSDRWLFFGAAGLGLGLAGGGSFWLGALALALTALGLGWVQPEARDDLSDVGAALRPQGRALLITAALSALLIATVCFTFIRGMGALVDSTLVWLAGFSPASVGRSPVILLVFLAAYEPLVVVFGIAGAISAFRRRWLLGQGLAWFGAIALVLLILTSGRRLPDIVWVAAPLAVLAGREIFESLSASLANANRPLAAAQAAITIGLTAFALLNVATYAEVVKNNGAGPTAFQVTVLGSPIQMPTVAQLGVAGLSVLLIFVVAYLIALGWSEASARLGLLLAGAGLFLAMTVSAGWGLTQLRPGSPAELWWQNPAAPQVRVLMQTLGNVSNYTAGMPHDIEVTVQASSTGLLGWALRDYPHAAFVDRLDPVINSPVVIAPVSEQNPTLGSSYVGESFGLRADWTADLSLPEWIGWAAYRRAKAQEVEPVILWVRQDIQQLQSSGSN